MLAYLFLSKGATLTQSNSLSGISPRVYFCLTPVRNIVIAVFVHLRRLNDITSNCVCHFIGIVISRMLSDRCLELGDC